MNAFCEFPDISVSGLGWTTPDRSQQHMPMLPTTRYPQGSFKMSYCLPRNSNYSWLDQGECLRASNLILSTALDTQPFTGDFRANSSDWQCMATAPFIADADLSQYLPQFDTFPLDKKIQIILTVGQIKGQIVDMELDEDDGQVVIRTLEDGHKCFYAICTEQGDFKGTWLPDGSLLTQPWSATPLYEALSHRLI